MRLPKFFKPYLLIFELLCFQTFALVASASEDSTSIDFLSEDFGSYYKHEPCAQYKKEDKDLVGKNFLQNYANLPNTLSGSTVSYYEHNYGRYCPSYDIVPSPIQLLLSFGQDPPEEYQTQHELIQYMLSDAYRQECEADTLQFKVAHIQFCCAQRALKKNSKLSKKDQSCTYEESSSNQSQTPFENYCDSNYSEMKDSLQKQLRLMRIVMGKQQFVKTNASPFRALRRSIPEPLKHESSSLLNLLHQSDLVYSKPLEPLTDEEKSFIIRDKKDFYKNLPLGELLERMNDFSAEQINLELDRLYYFLIDSSPLLLQIPGSQVTDTVIEQALKDRLATQRKTLGIPDDIDSKEVSNKLCVNLTNPFQNRETTTSSSTRPLIDLPTPHIHDFQLKPEAILNSIEKLQQDPKKQKLACALAEHFRLERHLSIASVHAITGTAAALFMMRGRTKSPEKLAEGSGLLTKVGQFLKNGTKAMAQPAVLSPAWVYSGLELSDALKMDRFCTLKTKESNAFENIRNANIEVNGGTEEIQSKQIQYILQKQCNHRSVDRKIDMFTSTLFGSTTLLSGAKAIQKLENWTKSIH
ncbi:MAG: hypothetical protein KDD50_11270 [Bdellovibrionales bacterium]|nr:hypothetical protein [Bdellovibrionales bacterium]